jgi:putative glutamine amidotransferase
MMAHRPGTLNHAPPVIGLLTRPDHSAAWSGYRLYGQGAVYSQAVALAGGAPVLIPLELGKSAWRSLYERLDGLLLPGGVDMDPAHYGEARHPDLGEVDDALDAAELVLTRWALEEDLPLLGICRGIQTLNVAAGGSLYQDLPAQFPGALQHRFSPPEYPRDHRGHTVHIQAGSRLAQVLETLDLPVNSRHHQAVKEAAPGFVVAARAPDGVIEGLEKPGARFCVGVQWHPESLAAGDPQMLALFEAFVQAAFASRRL